MKNTEFVTKLKNIATNYKTLYVMGCFGAPMTNERKETYIKHHKYNAKPQRAAMIRAASSDTFGFDCVCLIKGVLWGWDADTADIYGGAKYSSNGVPDIGTEQMIAVCSGVSSDFSNIQIGELLWMKGHVGVYIGDGLAVECTPAWKNKVQITAVLNIGVKSGYKGRRWVKHGRLPYITYEKTTAPVQPANKLTVDGKWGKGTTLRLQQIFGTKADGIVSNQWAKYKATNPGLRNGWEWEVKPNGRGSDLIRAMQKWAGMPANEQDGEIGPDTVKALQRKLGTNPDGRVSNPSQMVKALQKWANEQK